MTVYMYIDGTDNRLGRSINFHEYSMETMDNDDEALPFVLNCLVSDDINAISCSIIASQSPPIKEPSNYSIISLV